MFEVSIASGFACPSLHGQEEGGDALYSFLLDKSKLKSGLEPVYNALKANEIDKDGLTAGPIYETYYRKTTPTKSKQCILAS